jgi:hypothetical protein
MQHIVSSSTKKYLSIIRSANPLSVVVYHDYVKAFVIIPLMLALIALVPIGTLAFAQSEEEQEEEEQEQNDDSNNFYTKEIDGQTFKVYSDGRLISEETGSCYYQDQEGGTLTPCV